jgi:hypothetical protein
MFHTVRFVRFVTTTVVLLASMGSTENQRDLHKQELAKACKSNGGTWLDQNWECEYADQKWCTKAGGRFDECASACRHNPDKAAPCTMQCVPTCSFPTRNKNKPERQPQKLHLSDVTVVARRPPFYSR